MFQLQLGSIISEEVLFSFSFIFIMDVHSSGREWMTVNQTALKGLGLEICFTRRCPAGRRSSLRK